MKKISTEKAPAAIGPYSQAVAVGNLVFTSGQIPLDPKLTALCDKGIIELFENDYLDKAADAIEKLAAEKEIPVQFEIMGGETGTDADEISTAKNGVRTGLISIPQKYMHTPVEVVDTEDIKAVGRLMAEFAMGGAL